MALETGTFLRQKTEKGAVHGEDVGDALRRCATSVWESKSVHDMLFRAALHHGTAQQFGRKVFES